MDKILSNDSEIESMVDKNNIMEKFIDTTNITDEAELEKAIEANIKISKEIRKELEILEKYSFQEEINQQEKTMFVEEEETEDELTDEYLYYYEDIMNVPDDIDASELENIIRNNLPTTNNKNYQAIMLYIKFSIRSEILDYRSMMKSPTTTEQEALDYQKCIELDNLKCALIDKIEKEEKNDIEEDVQQKNKVIFFETAMGNNSPLNELKSISHEFYDSFFELFKSIEDGTLRDVKRFSGAHNILKGTREVRNTSSKTRIVFDRLDKDTYIIISLFVKKTDLDSIYVNSLSDKVSRYKNQKDTIIDKLKNDDSYIKRQQEYYEEFEGMLTENMKKGETWQRS